MGVRTSGFKTYNEHRNLRNKTDHYGASFSSMLQKWPHKPSPMFEIIRYADQLKIVIWSYWNTCEQQATMKQASEIFTLWYWIQSNKRLAFLKVEGVKSYKRVPPTERICAKSEFPGISSAATSRAIENACQKTRVRCLPCISFPSHLLAAHRESENEPRKHDIWGHKSLIKMHHTEYITTDIAFITIPA